jgi:hypothetical protein
MNKITSGIVVFAACFVLSGTAFADTGCVSINRNLSYGSRGYDVRTLQRFLVDQGYPGSGSWMINGRFGPATRVAVIDFQRSNGLSETGSVNSETRDAISRVSCGGYLSNTSYNSYNTYTPVQNQYTYTTPSTYYYPTTPVYQPQTYPVYTPQPSYPAATTPTIFSTNPNSGLTGSTVTITGSGFSTTGNTVRIGSLVVNNVTSLDGRTVSFIVPTTMNTYAGYPQYVVPGTYAMTVSNAYGYVSNAINFTITGSTVTANVSITGISGPSSIATNQVGTWTVTINNPSYTTATLNVSWGDTQLYAQASQPVQVVQGSQTLTVTHVYTTVGSYTPTFTVNNGSVPVTGTASVVVYGNTTSTLTPTITSISPNVARVGTSVTIYGSNFTGSNTILLNSGAMYNAYTATGNSLTFVVPSAIGAYCQGGQVCPMYAQTITPGTYTVSVMNSNGTSNVAQITIVQ